MHAQSEHSTAVIAALESLNGVTPSHEADLAEKAGSALARAGIEFAPEVWLNDTDRIDILAGRVGVELKLTGPNSSVTRQLARYADSAAVDELVLVTTRFAHKTIPGTLRGKRVTVLCVGGWM